MNFYKETTDYGVTVFSAVDPDYSHELQVTIAPNGLVSRMAMHPKPTGGTRTEITRNEYAEAFNNATATFTDFLKI